MAAAGAARPEAGPVGLLQQAAAAAAEAAAEAAAAVSAAAGGSGGAAAGAVVSAAKQQRPWDSWGLPRQRKKGPKMAGERRLGCRQQLLAPRCCCWVPAALPAHHLDPSTAPCLGAGLLWEVSAELASLGVSLVAPTREMAYLRAGGLRAGLAGTAAHLILDLELRHLQARLVGVHGVGRLRNLGF